MLTTLPPFFVWQICSLVGSIAVVSSVATLLALTWAAVPELYWAHVTT